MLTRSLRRFASTCSGSLRRNPAAFLSRHAGSNNTSSHRSGLIFGGLNNNSARSISNTARSIGSAINHHPATGSRCFFSSSAAARKADDKTAAADADAEQGSSEANSADKNKENAAENKDGEKTADKKAGKKGKAEAELSEEQQKAAKQEREAQIEKVQQYTGSTAGVSIGHLLQSLVLIIFSEVYSCARCPEEPCFSTTLVANSYVLH